MNKTSKISILGAGNVGATIAYTLTLEGLASEIVLVDINRDKARGEAMDIIQCTALCPAVNIRAGDYPDLAGSDIVVVTFGCARRPGQTRIDLAQGNVNIIRSVMPQAIRYAPNAIYVAVSNPVDIIAYAIQKVGCLPENQVFGSGTLLDSARLREKIAQYAEVNPKNVHGYVLGEHGDSSVIPWSLVTIGGIPADVFFEKRRLRKAEQAPLDHAAVADDVHRAGSEVIRLKGATFYAIAVSAAKICRNILRDTNSVLPLSGMLHGEYGIDGIYMSLPFVLNRSGVADCIAPTLTEEETGKLAESARLLKETVAGLNI